VRELTDHRVPFSRSTDVNNLLDIQVVGKPGPSGASHVYDIYGFNAEFNPAVGPLATSVGNSDWVRLVFQYGSIVGPGHPNGISIESLLAIVIDQLEAIQAGPHRCEKYAAARAYIKQGLSRLHEQTILNLGRETP
jgi:hypothetical protein